MELLVNKEFSEAKADIQWSIIFESDSLTGGGKTFCLFGEPEKVGIIHRSIAHLLKTTDSIYLKVIELVGEEAYDLNNDGTKIVECVTEKLRNTNDGFAEILSVVLSRRKQKQTDQNVTSSRYHLLITIKTDKVNYNELVVVDLAGFERPEGEENATESLFINSSLSHFNNVLISIARNHVVNYKLCALTKMLQAHLTASSRTLMLYHLAPHSVEKGLEYIKDVAASSKVLKRNATNSNLDMKRKPNLIASPLRERGNLN